MLRLRVADGGAERTLDLPAAGTFVVGRSPDTDLPVSDPRISRRHLQLRAAGGKLYAQDLGSSNGTFCNDDKLTAEREVQAGDRLRLGALVLTVVAAAPAVPVAPAAPGPGAPACAMAVDVVDAPVSVIRKLDLASALQAAVKTERLSAIHRLSEAVGSLLNRDALLDRLLALISETLPFERGAVLLSEDGKLVPRACRERSGAAATLRVPSSIAAQTLASGTGLLIADTGTDPRFAAQQSIVALNIRSALCVPLIARGTPLGIIYVDSGAAAGTFTEDDLSFLSVAAAQAALFIDNLALFARVQEEERQRANLARFLSPRIVERALASPAGMALGGQAQAATVLFADIRNFSELTARLQPQDLVTLLNEYFTAMTEVVFRYEGTLDNFIGDALMAEFGVPFPQADDAFRAVTAAQEMRRKLTELRGCWTARNLKGFDIGIGINTGKVVAGNIGSQSRMQYTVIGEAVNTASRICAKAQANQILITAATWEKLGPAVKTNKLLPLTIKGAVTGVQVYEVLD